MFNLQYLCKGVSSGGEEDAEGWWQKNSPPHFLIFSVFETFKCQTTRQWCSRGRYSDSPLGGGERACVCVSKHNSFPVWCQCLSEVEHAVVWNWNFPRRGKNDLCLNLLFLQHLTASCCFHTKFSVRNLSFLALCMQVTLALSHVCAYVCVNVCVCVCDVVSSPSVSLRMCMQVMPLPRWVCVCVCA